MTSTVDIDKRIKDIHIKFVHVSIHGKKEYILFMTNAFAKKIKPLIREVAEEVITTKTKRAKSDYENGWNDCVDTCNENLNKLLGEK